VASLSITPLGTNGFVPTHGRQTMSYLLRRAGVPILLDAGSGLGRLLEPALAGALEGADRLRIVLSHYHLDHTIGISYLTAVAGGRPVTIWAPAPPLVDGRPEEALERLIGPPLFPLRLAGFPMPVEVVPYGGDTLEVAGATIRLRRQRHDGGSVGMVVDGRLGYLTDCEVEEASVGFAGGVELLIHEVWLTDEQIAAGAKRHGHSTAEEVARLATACGAGALMPVHHHPARDAAAIAEVAARIAAGTRVPVVLAEEGREYVLPLGGLAPSPASPLRL
jgi:ribonuclease BN (tRNA processing enzyme)